MEARAELSNLRISPRKVRKVVNLIRNKSVVKALNELEFMNQKSVVSIKKLINSVTANAANNHGMEADKLVIKKIYVNESSTLKRFRPRAQGRAFPIKKRSSNIVIVVSDEK